MFKHKRNLVLLTTLFLLVGCKPSDEGSSTTTRLQVWGAGEEKALYEWNEARWNAKYPNNKIKLGIGNVGESEAATNLLKDVTTGADIFMYADDQTEKMVAKGVLAKLPESYKNKVTARDVASAVDAATYAGDNEMYAFPTTADNGYYLVYNNKYLNATDVLTLEGILAKTDVNHQFVMDTGNGYYGVSFLQYISEINYNPLTQLHTTNFNNQDSIDAADGAASILRPKLDKGFLAADLNGNLLDDFSNANNNKVIAGITGNWNYKTLKHGIGGKAAILGDDLSITKLPTFKNSKGVDVQMGSFAGSKLTGVKSSSTNIAAALAFAEFMNDKEAQLHRWEINGWGPSNKEAQTDPKLENELGLKALALQAPYSIAQSRSVGSKFWDAGAAVGTFIANGPTEGGPQTTKEVLDAFVEALTK